ncbi:MAG: hypothetical protein RLZ98_2226, partial [Pseudomonadota bacterium]
MMRKLGAALIAVLAGVVPAAAESVSDFYKGKTIRFIVRTNTGGDYDLYSRLFARHWGKHIPGNPNFVVNNMTGGGGIIAANFMGTVAPKDGTVVGIVSQGLALHQALGLPGLKFDMKSFKWIANIIQSNQLLVVYKDSPAKTIEDAKKTEITIGTTGAGSASTQYPAFYNNVLGTKFRLVTGYRSGTAIDLAMERGEVHGRGTNPYSSYMASKPDWIPTGKIIPIMQAGLKKEKELPNVPFILDQQVSEENKPLLLMMARASAVGRPLATTPGVPEDRLKALRESFQKTLSDPELQADAKRSKLDLSPLDWKETGEIIDGILDAPADVKQRMKAALEPKSEQMTKATSDLAAKK